jgi:hypothetical protein
VLKYWGDTLNRDFMNRAIDYREHYKTLLNKLHDGSMKDPTEPRHFQKDTGRGTKGGTAYCSGPLHAIYLRKGFFGFGPVTRSRLLRHELARRYLWDELPLDYTLTGGTDEHRTDLKYVENFDEFVDWLDRDYEELTRPTNPRQPENQANPRQPEKQENVSFSSAFLHYQTASP